MDELAPLANRLAVLVAPAAARLPLIQLTARLALQGPLRVIDAGNQFNALLLARPLRRATPRLNAALQNVRLTRAFTCYQVLALLERRPAEPLPTLVFDLLGTFYDENVPLPESRRLLGQALAGLQRLAAAAPVVAGLRPPAEVVAARGVLLETALAAASDVWTLAPPPTAPAARQPGLWD